MNLPATIATSASDFSTSDGCAWHFGFIKREEEKKRKIERIEEEGSQRGSSEVFKSLICRQKKKKDC